jgi:hypothetical protein
MTGRKLSLYSFDIALFAMMLSSSSPFCGRKSSCFITTRLTFDQ